MQVRIFRLFFCRCRTKRSAYDSFVLSGEICGMNILKLGFYLARQVDFFFQQVVGLLSPIRR